MKPGDTVGPYRIDALLGAGGMGEVYRAHDTKLNRDVAIKVLLAAVANDAERLSRFKREAQVLASLNHPNIGGIYGLEDQDAAHALVLELVGGPTLADRLARGPIAIDETIAIARQIADALEAAHERGVIHRDLKPANIKVDDHGTVKVLDFGLAKALDASATSEGGSFANSPTITSPAMTQAGLILGTAAYMSPEQAKGRAVDKRSDVWAFGCVLYEMLTATRAFGGEDVTDTIAAVVRGEPDWSKLPAGTPQQIRLLLKRSLEKDRKTRISDIGVARFVLNETTEPAGFAADTPPRSHRRRMAVAMAASVAAGAAAVAVAWVLWARVPESNARPLRVTITPPAEQSLIQTNTRDVVMAPDGSYVLYSSRAKSAQSQLMVRALDALDSRPLPGTLGARLPFTSPDGRWVGFLAEDELRKVAISGGGAVAICRLPRASSASWGDDGFIVAATTDGSLYRVAADGGEPKTLIAPDSERREQYQHPHVLPGSAWVLFTVRTGADMQGARIDALHLASGKRQTVVRGGYDPAYVDSGHLVYVVPEELSSGSDGIYRGSLRAVRFNAVRAEISGDSVSMVSPLAVVRGPTDYSVSRSGDLIFVPYGTARQPARTLVWVDRKGRETAIPAEPRSYEVARISPDGARIVLDLRDQTNDIWTWDIARQTLTPLNRDPGQDMSPLWTPDGKRIIWTSSRGGGFPNLFSQAADGSGNAERLTTNPTVQFPISITPDGVTVLGFTNAGGNSNLFRVSIAAGGQKAEPLPLGPAREYDPEISPDGKWLAYHSDESGESQVYVRPFPNVASSRLQVSTAGGSRAAWSRTGKELFYLDQDGLLTAVTVQAIGGKLSAGLPAKVLNTRYHGGASLGGFDLRSFDVSPDGQRFLMIKEVDSIKPTNESLTSMILVMNWAAELKSRLSNP